MDHVFYLMGQMLLVIISSPCLATDKSYKMLDSDNIQARKKITHYLSLTLSLTLSVRPLRVSPKVLCL